MKKFKVTKSQIPKVKNPLPVPTICPNCGGAVELVNNSVIYRREYGDWPWAYRCIDNVCDSHVGIHPKTDIPLGTLANKVTRDARKKSKGIFMSLWGGMGMERDCAYAWLAEKMGIDPAMCHFGWFSIPQCNRVIEVCNASQKEESHV